MFYECNGTRSFTDEEVDGAIARKAMEKPGEDHPWEEVAEQTADLRVAEAMGKGAHILDAQGLPYLTYNELLMRRLAEIEAEPARVEFAKVESERKQKEEEDAKKRGR